MAPPRQWHLFTGIPYEWCDDGRIRDKSRNVINDDHRLFRTHSRAQLLAREWFGIPPRHRCPVCGDGPPWRVVHLDGNRRNCARLNLKYAPDDAEARAHELRCIESSQREGPPRRMTERVLMDKDGGGRGRTPLLRRTDRPQRMFFADDDECLTERGSPFKPRSQATVPEQSRAMRFLTLPMDYNYAADRRAFQPYNDE